MNMDWKKIGIIVGIVVTVFGSAYGLFEVGVNLDSRYAKAADLVQTTIKLNLFGLKLLHNEALAEYYLYRKLTKAFPKDEELKRQFDRAIKNRDNIEEQIKEAKKSLKGKF